VTEAQGPEPAEIGRPAEMLGQDRGIEADFSGLIRQRVHAPAEVDDFSLLDPAGELEADRRPSIGEGLHEERQVKAGKPADEAGQIALFHMR